MNSPLLIIVSPPSGAGKTTLCRRLLDEFDGVDYSISCTTRRPRGNEIDGRDYHFLSESEFLDRLERGAFLEHAVVHGFRYGTLKASIEDAMNEGRSVLLDIDVQGCRQARDVISGLPADNPMRRGFVDIFVAPPSIEELRSRLAKRGEDSAATIERRLENAKAEMARADDYSHVIVNDDLDAAYGQFRAIIEGAWAGEG